MRAMIPAALAARFAELTAKSIMVDNIEVVRNGFVYLFDGYMLCAVAIRDDGKLIDVQDGGPGDDLSKFAVFDTVEDIVDRMEKDGVL